MQKIILLHGALGSSADMAPLAEILTHQQQFIPYTFSFSGHGEKKFEIDFGIDQFSHELENFIIDNHLKGCMVFGYSMGGYVALRLASKRADLLSGIITLATKFNWTKDTIVREAGNCDLEFLKSKVPDFLKALQNKHTNILDLLPKTKKMIEHFEENNYLDKKAMENIFIPVLLGVGDSDKMVTHSETFAAREQLRDGGMYVLPYTKHPFEQIDINHLAVMLRTFEKKLQKKKS